LCNNAKKISKHTSHSLNDDVKERIFKKARQSLKIITRERERARARARATRGNATQSLTKAFFCFFLFFFFLFFFVLVAVVHYRRRRLFAP
jgi:hypothetical protein